MARRRPPELPNVAKETGDRVRDAVERTVQATVGSAERTRGTLDELVRGAEAGFTRSRRAVVDALPATQEDLRDVRRELRAIARRLDAIEQRLPAKRSQSTRRAPAGRKAASKRQK